MLEKALEIPETYVSRLGSPDIKGRSENLPREVGCRGLSPLQFHRIPRAVDQGDQKALGRYWLQLLSSSDPNSTIESLLGKAIYGGGFIVVGRQPGGSAKAAGAATPYLLLVLEGRLTGVCSLENGRWELKGIIPRPTMAGDLSVALWELAAWKEDHVPGVAMLGRASPRGRPTAIAVARRLGAASIAKEEPRDPRYLSSDSIKRATVDSLCEARGLRQFLEWLDVCPEKYLEQEIVCMEAAQSLIEGRTDIWLAAIGIEMSVAMLGGVENELEAKLEDFRDEQAVLDDRLRRRWDWIMDHSGSCPLHEKLRSRFTRDEMPPPWWLTPDGAKEDWQAWDRFAEIALEPKAKSQDISPS